ncbi:MAG TPA: PA14 domain-containing protein, partial [Chitinophagaceae bacterium]|nr:PA14 domain-containing protein [Chitinophagaceae bacterium]
MKPMKFFIAFMFFYIHAMAQAPAVSFDPIAVSTIAPNPGAVLGPADPAGNIYIAGNNRVSKMSPNGTVTIIAGTGNAGFVDGPAATAQFSGIAGLALDAAGYIYVSDGSNHAIRKISPGGIVSTLAGNGTAGNQDGIGTAARFNGPQGIAVDMAANVYVADTYNQSIRKITPAGVVSVFAGNGSPENQFSDPRDMAIDPWGNLYVQQTYGQLCKISSTGLVSIIYPPGFFGFKAGVITDKMGNIYISDWVTNNPNTTIIYKIFPGGDAPVLAGSINGYKDTIGTYAQFAGAQHVSIDDPGNIYVSDANGIRKISKPKLNFAGNAGAPSPAKYFAISGNYLGGPANLQAPPGYELSLSETGPYSAALTVGSAAGEILVRKIYIRLTASVPAGVYNDSVVLSASGAITQKLGVSGTVTNSPKKLVIIGSGTSACIGLDPSSECYVGRLNSAYNKLAPFDTTIDNHLARGSTNCYNGMPSSYVSPYPASSGYVPVTDINITAALALHPDAILVNYPTNGYNALSVNEIMYCLRTIRDSSNKQGVPCFITTTQPRTSPASFNTPAIKLKLAALKDSILAAFGAYAIDFWTDLINPADSSVLYDSGDHTNMNAAGHNVLSQRVLAKNVFASPVATGGPGTGLQGTYYNFLNFIGPPALKRIDPTVNNDYGSASPAPGTINADNYSVRWSGQVKPQFSETYTFYAITDDGVRLWVNGVLLIDNWVDQLVATERSGTITLVAGQKYDIIMEYYKSTGNGVAKLLWSGAHTAKAIIPAAQLYPPNQPAPTVPACAVNITPVNGATINTATNATLIWAPVANATEYYVYIWTGTTDPALPYGYANTSTFNASGLSSSTLYNWYVIPKNEVFTASGCGTTNKTSFTTAPITAGGTGTGLQGDYFNGIALSGTALLTRIDTAINFVLDYNQQPVVLSPAPGIVPEDLYSVRWTGFVQPLYAETYTFYTNSDDGIRLWVNNVLLIDSWIDQDGSIQRSGSIALLAGQKYDIKIEFYEKAGSSVTKLYWSSPSTAKAIVPKSQLYPAGSVSLPIPACATNTAPANGATIAVSATASLSWNASANATSYDVFIWTGASAPASPTANVTTTSYNATGLTASTLYNWYVTPKNATGSAAGCSTTNKTTFTTAAATTAGTGTGLQGVYYNGIALAGAPLLTRVDTSINFIFDYDQRPVVLSPAPGIVPDDLYSVRWTGFVQPLYTETYTFYTNSDDGIRLWVNNVQLIDSWIDQDGSVQRSGTIALVAGQKYDIRIEFYEKASASLTRLYWSSPSTAKAIVPKSQLYPAATTPPPTGAGTGLQGVYYNGIALAGAALLTRIDTSINFIFDYDQRPVVLSPAPGIVPDDLYSVRWTGFVQPLYSETYTFYTNSDDGIRLWVNNVQLID